jgi:uncharacterized membrane protein
MSFPQFNISQLPPECPLPYKNAESTELIEAANLFSVHYLSTMVVYACIALVSTIFAVVAIIKYNSVKVLRRRIYDKKISNSFWIFYFIVIAIREICNTIQYGWFSGQGEAFYREYLISLVMLLSGLNILILTLALDHQRKYRSSSALQADRGVNPSMTSSVDFVASSPLINIEDSNGFSLLRYFMKHLHKIIFLLLWIIFMAFFMLFYMMTSNDGKLLYIGLFFGSFVIQRIPVIILMIFIVLDHKKSEYGETITEGPSKSAKILLTLTVIANLVTDMPLSFWSSWLNPGYDDSCIFIVASWIDFILVLYLFSLICYFIFLRLEFLRNREECIWSAVCQYQESFDFRNASSW